MRIIRKSAKRNFASPSDDIINYVLQCLNRIHTQHGTSLLEALNYIISAAKQKKATLKVEEITRNDIIISLLEGADGYITEYTIPFNLDIWYILEALGIGDEKDLEKLILNYMF